MAAGVNLPARRVIIQHAYQGRTDCPLDGTSFRQMAGRAGRAGIDTEGECYVIQQGVSPALIRQLVTEGPAPVQSCLVEGKRGEPPLEWVCKHGVSQLAGRPATHY